MIERDCRIHHDQIKGRNVDLVVTAKAELDIRQVREPLQDIRKAQQDFLDKQFIGKLVLIPPH